MRARRSDEGFTLIELVITIVIMGVITVPLGNFALSYLKNYAQTEGRVAGSHDIQIATAYFSQDVANFGLRGASPTYSYAQSVWTAPTGTYCGSGLGTTLLLLKWDDWTVSGSTGTGTQHSAAYVIEGATALHRVYCTTGTTTTSDTTLVHNLVYPDSGNPTPVVCSTTCTSTTVAPATITLTLSIRATNETVITRTSLKGDRRQT